MINQVTLVGRLTKEPTVRYTVEGRPVLNITLALNRHFKNAKGDVEADFVLCTLWNKAAENTAKYCKKGSLIGIMGRIQSRYYDDDKGKRVYVTEVVADSVKFMDSRQTSNNTSTAATHEDNRKASNEPTTKNIEEELLPF